ncbi:MAG: spermidine synthase [Nocardioidaceae bacterium]
MEYVEVARATSPRGEVVLRERRDEASPEAAPVALELRVNGVFVMDTLETATEKELARVALTHVPQPRSVLVGGLGLGFTLHEVLGDDRVEHLTVVEIEDSLVRWMRDGTVPHGPSFLADHRLQMVTADIRVAVDEAAHRSYDLVLLDVDNGPGFLVYDDNAAVYDEPFLRRLRTVLRPHGVLAIWSADESPELLATMERAFGQATPIPYDVRLQERDERYWLYLSPA